MTPRERLDTKLAAFRLAAALAEAERAALAAAEQRTADVAAAQKIVQAVAEEVQQQAHRQISSVVSRCLEAVFGPDAYEFRICFEQKRGRTEARLAFVRDGVELDPTTSAGGGVVDVAAFALRLACLVLAIPKRRRFLCLDEPAKMLSANYSEVFGELLMTLAEEMGIQILMVTHQDGLRVGWVVELGP